MNATERRAVRALIDARRRVILNDPHTDTRAAPPLSPVPVRLAEVNREPLDDRTAHAHRGPLPGFCQAFVNLGPRFVGRVRCSFRASRGDYCGRHAA